ncbi:hypothetical protein F4553_002324 [Allocatelliglobosispora scoriae]|uniref:Dynamin family protein n=1 Tax=Allocatelliglobosispora scoriae TaxID=643052 RepID=A0A841BMQ4_9ACTN|nr:hypothetical protein [Allocatelliglobosispora scoriae]MBB5868945.1 hypothetical protein [Allocatelliglobosispora scoriae]
MGTAGAADSASQITRIVNARAELLPRIRSRLDQWIAVEGHLNNLASLVGPGISYPELQMDLAQMRTAVDTTLAALRLVERRCSRDSINVGVGGDARMGKSTLLQAISGLTDQHIPTGSDLPVTAARSRITYTSGEPRAVLTLRTFEGFRQEVLVPYHERIGLGPAPLTPFEFENHVYPATLVSGGAEDLASTTRQALLNELRELHRAFPGYRDLLVGGTKEVSLDEIAGYVAYETAESIAAGQQRSARYMAVDHADIMSRYRNDDARQLCLVDLPGLGELSPRVAAESHAAALRDDIDVALMIKRAAPTTAFWGERDANALGILDMAKGPIRHVADFAVIVVNRHPDDGGRIPAMRRSIEEKLHESGEQVIQIFEVDVHDTTDVNQRLLPFVLEFVAERLQRNDRAIFDGLEVKLREQLASVAEALHRMRAAIARSAGSVHHHDDELIGRAERLRSDLAGGLQTLMTELHALTTQDAVDRAYETLIEQIHAEVREWIVGGLGMAESDWFQAADDAINRDGHGLNFSSRELDRVRVELGGRYAVLDTLFAERVRNLQDQIVKVLLKHLPPLTAQDPSSPAGALLELAQAVEQADYPADGFGQAVRALAAVRLDFGTQMYPQIRSELRRIAYVETNPTTGQQIITIRPDDSASLREQIIGRALSGADGTRRALILKKLPTASILHAVAEQFEDSVIRSGDAEQEFRNILRSYYEVVPQARDSDVSYQLIRFRRFSKTMLEHIAAMEAGS